MKSFLFDVDAWLSSTAVSAMTADEERGYLRLLLHAWKQPDCGLPDDDGTLATLSLIGARWKRSAAKLRACFQSREGRLYNRRLLEEWEYQRRYHSERATAGAKGAAKRWGNRSEPDSSAIAEPLAKLSKNVENRWLFDARAKSEERRATAAANSPSSPSPPLDADLAQIAEALHGCMAPGALPPDEAIVRQIAAAVPHASAEDVAEWAQRFRRRRKPPESYGFFAAIVAEELSPKRLALIRTARPMPEDPKAEEEQRAALERDLAAEAEERLRVDAEIARREAAGTLEADLKRHEGEARAADPLWDRKPVGLRREVALAGVRGEFTRERLSPLGLLVLNR